MKKNIIKDKTFQFSLKSIDIYRKLLSKKEYVIAKQLLRSSTSIGANIAEAQYGSSQKDFLAKLRISLKEASETKYWIELLRESKTLKDEDYEFKCNEIIKILVSIVNTTTKNLK